MRTVPRKFHFIFGLREQKEPFHLVWYLCLKSCLEVNKPDNIFFHYKNEPYGEWWEKIKPYLDLVPLGEHVDTGLDESKYDRHEEGRFIKRFGFQYAHHADVLRLQILEREGGVYADIDTLFVRPYPDEFYDSECLLGEEVSDDEEMTLCNAVIIAKPNSHFITKWLKTTHIVFDGSWNRHSCVEAARLSVSHPELVRVIDKRHFFHFDCSVEGLANLFAKNLEYPDDLYSIHLWSHVWWNKNRVDFTRFHAGMLNEAFIRKVDTSFNRIARRFLD